MQNETEIKGCPFAQAACTKEHCALYTGEKCSITIIAENTSGIKEIHGVANSTNGIWGELRDRY